MEVPDYYDVIKGHNDERAQITGPNETHGGLVESLFRYRGWFGSFWESIMNFFKKAGMILLMVLILGLAIYVTIKLLFCLISKVAKIKKPS